LSSATKIYRITNVLSDDDDRSDATVDEDSTRKNNVDDETFRKEAIDSQTVVKEKISPVKSSSSSKYGIILLLTLSFCREYDLCF
jgi:hypothetical protein